MKKTTLHLKGSTLLEVLTSLSILALVFTLGMNLFQPLTGRYSPVEQAKTRNLVREMLYKPLPAEVIPDMEYEIEGRILHKQVRLLDKTAGMYEITVEAYWQDQAMEQRKRIVQIP